MGDFLQEESLPNQVDRVLVTEHRLGQAGERGEFVDHLPEIADLADDRAGQLLEQLAILLDLLAVAALEPLGGKLNRGERILDLVRDTAGDIGPCGLALIDELTSDVVESD